MQEDGAPRLRVPEPPSRPGQQGDYSHLHFPAAGEAARPAVDANAARITDLTSGLVRVPDDDGIARRP
jgi:2-oxoisovalerate dehydrogenase E1 component alpha subunit